MADDTMAAPVRPAPPVADPVRPLSRLGRILRTTAVKLSLVYLVVFSVVTVALVAYITQSTSAILTTELRQAVDSEVAELRHQDEIGGIQRVATLLDARSRQPGAGLYLVTDPAGQPLLGNISDLPAGLVGLADDAVRTVPYRRLNQRMDSETRHVAIVHVFTLESGFRVLVGRDVGEREKFRGLIWEAMRAVIGVTVVLGLATWWFVSRSVLKRIDQIAITSNRIAAGDLSGRLSVAGSNDEFDRLAVSLNHMFDRIGDLMQGLKDVSDNIAHDLKTPLTRLRNRAEEALGAGTGPEEMRAALDGVISDCDGLIQTFDALLTIARMDAGNRTVTMMAVSPGEIAREILELYEPVAEDADVAIDVVDDGALALANRELIAQAIANLVDNALKYGRADQGPSRIRIRSEAMGSEVVLSVADNGPGIAEADRARVLDRFVRLESSRHSPGSGLGLSLVAAIARQHGRTIELGDAQPGLMVTLRLPQAGPPGGGETGQATR